MILNYKGKQIEIEDKLADIYKKVHGDIDTESIEYLLYTGGIDENAEDLSEKVKSLMIEDLKVGLDISKSLKELDLEELNNA